jgi:hypothetical protein
MVAVLVVSLSHAGCAAADAGQSAQRAPAAPSEKAVPVPRLRQVGPDDEGREVVLRFGDQLDVVPARRPDGWVVADYASGILRLHGSPDAAADSHTFYAIAVGEGRLLLAPAGPQARSTGVFTLRIRVLRDTVQTPP